MSSRPAFSLIRPLSSIWTGIALLALMIVYSAIGSAIPPIRQYFELSELGWFDHWVFGALIILFCVVLITATVRRIRFNLVNAGVLTVHTGLLLLAGGSLLYFGRKIEGDVFLLPPRIEVLSVSRMSKGEPSTVARIIAAEGKSWQADMPMIGGAHRIDVTRVSHNGMTTAQEATVSVRSGASDSVRELRLIQNASPVEINEHLKIRLIGANTADTFFNGDVPALYVTARGREVMLPLPELPRYHERFLPGAADIREKPMRDEPPRNVVSARTTANPLLEYWRLPISPIPADSVAAKDLPVRLEVDGFLPYAELEQVPVAGGTRLNPVLSAELTVGNRREPLFLAGQSPALSRDGVAGVAVVEFRWLDAPSLPPEWTSTGEGQHLLTVEVKDKGLRRTFAISQGQEIAVEGTDYRLKVDLLSADWPLMTPGFERARSPVAQVSVTQPGKQYQRTVIERYPQLSQDIDEKGTRHREGPYDPNLVLTYRDCSAHSVLIAAGPELSPVMVHYAPGGARRVQQLRVGQTASIADGVSLAVRELIEKPRMDNRPLVIPVAYRQRNLGRGMSMIRVKATAATGNWSQHAWIPFTQYGSDAADDRRAVTLDLPDFGPIDLVFGRKREPLGGRVTLEKMVVDFNPGRMSVRDWSSYVRLEGAAARDVQAERVYLNHTAKLGPWTLFQSSAPSDQSEDWTVLGVGNRIGMIPMTLGCILIALGMMYAFYVKPVIKRRQKERFAMQAATNENCKAGHQSMNGNGSMTDITDVAARTDKGREPAAGTPAKLPVIFVAILAPWLGGGAYALAQSGPRMPDDDVHKGAAMPAAQDGDHEGSSDGVPNDAEDGGAQAVARDPYETAVARKAIADEALLTLRQMAERLDVTPFRLMTVQHNNLYQTGEAWSRTVVKAVTGKTTFEGLDPVVWALELVFNPKPHVDRNMLYIKDLGLRHDITAYPVELDPAERERIWRTGMVSFRFLSEPAVREIITALKSQVMLKRATDRAESAAGYFMRAPQILTVVPAPTGTRDTPWHSIEDLVANLEIPGRSHSHDEVPVAGISGDTARSLMRLYFELAQSWGKRDAEGVNRALASLAGQLPPLAPRGLYPSLRTRELEVRYYRWNALVHWGWGLYLLALLASVFSMASGWRGARACALLTFVAAIVVHGGGLAIRWYITGRIPVANMFESVVASAFIGVVLALGFEWRLLHWAQSVWLLPLSAAVWLCIDSQSDMWKPVAVVGVAGLVGHILWSRFRRGVSEASTSPLPAGIFAIAGSFLGFLSLTIMSLANEAVGSEIGNIQAILDTVLLRIHTVLIIASYATVTLGYGVANVYLVCRAVRGSRTAWVTLGGQVAVAAYLFVMLYAMPEVMGAKMRTITKDWPAVIGGLVRGDAGLMWFGTLLSCAVGAGLGRIVSAFFSKRRGASDSGELVWDGVDLSRRVSDSPFMQGLDKSQMIFMNMANVGLFVGIILGAWWADHSWGRPWGWDPKEVFALTTWLIYAILIHVRFVVRDRGLWSAVVGVLGFAMMMFNWWAVNFYIVGLHSYA